MKARKSLLIALATTILVGVSSYAVPAQACGFFSSCNQTSSDLQKNEQATVAANQQKMVKAVPAPNLDNSLERQNISKRLTLFDNPNKVSYIYLVSFGKVMSFYTVKGKITSGTKRLTASQQQIDSTDCGSGQCELTLDAPELDGTYGSSSPYIYFWTTDGAYIQWSGDYMLADQPLQLSTQPELTRTVQ